jgi:hypothetical protein
VLNLSGRLFFSYDFAQYLVLDLWVKYINAFGQWLGIEIDCGAGGNQADGAGEHYLLQHVQQRELRN